jgi:hypothetical protein
MEPDLDAVDAEGGFLSVQSSCSVCLCFFVLFFCPLRLALEQLACQGLAFLRHVDRAILRLELIDVLLQGAQK